MEKIYIDLHIHTALSPCGDKIMTPNNIVNMSKLKGLDIIGITDHNSMENCEAAIEIGKEVGVLVVPGMEIQTSEEIHLLTLYPTIEIAKIMNKIVYENLLQQKNKEEIFGNQLIFDKEDNIISKSDKFLIGATKLTIDDVFKIATDLGGVVIPAHINRESYSIISNLGMIPEYLNIKYVEISKSCNKENFINQNKYLKKYEFIKSSDAHYIGDILEQDTYLEIEEKTIECLIHKLKSNNIF